MNKVPFERQNKKYAEFSKNLHVLNTHKMQCL